MSDIQRLTHSSWECKYHVVFIPKYRQKRIYGEVRRELRQVFHDLVRRKESEIIEGYLMPDHVHMLISIPPKYSVAHLIGYLKGRSALHLAQKYGRRRKCRGYSFWARGYYVSTVGCDEQVVRRYIRNQEKADKAYDQQSLFSDTSFKK